MSRRRIALVLSGVLAVLLLTPVPETGARQPQTGSGQPPVARPLKADRELLRQAMVEARIATDRSRPGLTLWARDAGLAISQRMAAWMERVLPGFNRWLAPVVEPVLVTMLALLAAVLLVLVMRFAGTRWRRRAQVTTSPAPVQHLDTADEADARDWEGDLRRSLGSGDVATAIEALWWWLATGLVADRAEPSWTSRELVVRAGRRDLLADVRRLDRMMYGATRPQADEVRRLWGRLRESVG